LNPQGKRQPPSESGDRLRNPPKKSFGSSHGFDHQEEQKLKYQGKNTNTMSKFVPKEPRDDAPGPVVNIRLLQRLEEFIDDLLEKRVAYQISFSPVKRATLSRFGPECKYLLTISQGPYGQERDTGYEGATPTRLLEMLDAGWVFQGFVRDEPVSSSSN
jgi:hypothetical protein